MMNKEGRGEQNSELGSIRALERHDNLKKARERRKNYLGLLGILAGFLIGLLITSTTLKVSPKDISILGKTSFASKEKIGEYVPKIGEIDNKLKNSLVSRPMKWLSKKHEEEIRENTHVIGPLTISPSLHSSLKSYASMLLAVWIIVLVVFCVIFSWLFYWIIGKFIWKEPILAEQGTD